MSVIQEAIRKIKIRKLGVIDWNVFPFKTPLDSKIPSRRLLNFKSLVLKPELYQSKRRDSAITLDEPDSDRNPLKLSNSKRCVYNRSLDLIPSSLLKETVLLGEDDNIYNRKSMGNNYEFSNFEKMNLKIYPIKTLVIHLYF